MTNRAFGDASPLWQLARGCQWAPSGFFSCYFLPPPLQQQNPFPGAFLGKALYQVRCSASAAPLRPCPAGMLKGPVPASSEHSRDATTPCPLFRHSQQHRDSRDEARCSFLKASRNPLAPRAGQGCSRRLMLAGIIPSLPLWFILSE